jgi:hypothetical protein
MITVVGGFYLETCMQPVFHDYVGSGGRAALVLDRLGVDVKFHSYADQYAQMVITVNPDPPEHIEYIFTKLNQQQTNFRYHHSLASPAFSLPSKQEAPFNIDAAKVIRYGMLEGDAIVNAKYAVFDPQSPHPSNFTDNGSTAEHLAFVLNEKEAAKITGLQFIDPMAAAKILIEKKTAEVVIIKMGPKGLIVATDKGVDHIPPYQTNRVWKIGSGDTFVATFGYFWMHENLSPFESAVNASKATAFYVENMCYASLDQLKAYNPPAVMFSDRYNQGYIPKIYLAGPFFSLAQLWLIDEVKKNLREMGMRVFSPYDEVGLGPADKVVQKDLKGIEECDLVFAICDGMDAGTIYEIGYAKALSKPVVVYAENETSENLKMMEGSGCYICNDYATAIYSAVWLAVGL